jgi:hypothetical protein
MTSAIAPSITEMDEACPAVRQVDLRWVTTAPHLKPRHTRPRLPWGTLHIRPNGAHRTACGEPTTLWHTFWEIPVDTQSAQMCGECAQQAARVLYTYGVR